jgi:hypothetical protein
VGEQNSAVQTAAYNVVLYLSSDGAGDADGRLLGVSRDHALARQFRGATLLCWRDL